MSPILAPREGTLRWRPLDLVAPRSARGVALRAEVAPLRQEAGSHSGRNTPHSPNHPLFGAAPPPGAAPPRDEHGRCCPVKSVSGPCGHPELGARLGGQRLGIGARLREARDGYLQPFKLCCHY